LTVGTERHTSTSVVLPQVAEIVRGFVIGPEIVGVDRAKQGVVVRRIELAHETLELESKFDIRRRQLEMVGRHVTVGTGAAVAREPVQPPIAERLRPARHRVARLAATQRRTPAEACVRGRLREVAAPRAHDDRG
jgi:hypothetical protein